MKASVIFLPAGKWKMRSETIRWLGAKAAIELDEALRDYGGYQGFEILVSNVARVCLPGSSLINSETMFRAMSGGEENFARGVHSILNKKNPPEDTTTEARAEDYLLSLKIEEGIDEVMAAGWPEVRHMATPNIISELIDASYQQDSTGPSSAIVVLFREDRGVRYVRYGYLAGDNVDDARPLPAGFNYWVEGIIFSPVGESHLRNILLKIAQKIIEDQRGNNTSLARESCG